MTPAAVSRLPVNGDQAIGLTAAERAVRSPLESLTDVARPAVG